MDLHLDVRNKEIRFIDAPPVIDHNADYRFVFDFDEEWDAYDEKTVRVRTGKTTYTDIVMDSSNICELPQMDYTLTISVGVYAGTVGNQHATTTAEINMVKSVLA